jgi:hypothetical protein
LHMSEQAQSGGVGQIGLFRYFGQSQPMSPGAGERTQDGHRAGQGP